MIHSIGQIHVAQNVFLACNKVDDEEFEYEVKTGTGNSLIRHVLKKSLKRRKSAYISDICGDRADMYCVNDYMWKDEFNRDVKTGTGSSITRHFAIKPVQSV